MPDLPSVRLPKKLSRNQAGSMLRHSGPAVAAPSTAIANESSNTKDKKLVAALLVIKHLQANMLSGDARQLAYLQSGEEARRIGILPEFEELQAQLLLLGRREREANPLSRMF